MKTKKTAFYAIAISLPFILLALAEIVLRAVGYGQTYPLFVPAPQLENYLQPNPELIKRYFAANANTPKVAPDTFLFPATKQPNTFRIVTMGGSTMAGFPYGRFGSVAGMLKQRFKASHPSQHIEIISVAMSSINSYTLLDISQEVVDIKPDLVLIYAGHNEYLGVMGVGSVYASKGGHAANLLYLKLKEVRLFQVMQSLLSFFTNETENIQTNASQQRTVMAQIAENKGIYYQDEVYKAGLYQFSENLSLILSTFEQANVPVIISTLVANENELKPFESASDPHLDKMASLLIDEKTRTAMGIISKDVNQATQITHADYFYGLGKRFETAGDIDNAHAYYQKAKDFDLLRFRAPSDFNEIIMEKATQHGAILVNAHQYLHNAGYPLIGNNLMLEHLHPNHKGYFLLAEAFYETLLVSEVGSNAITTKEYGVSREQAWNLSPLTKADEILADYKIASLVSDYPFTDSKLKVDIPEAKTALDDIGIRRIEGESWLKNQQALLTYYQQIQDFERAANVAGIMFDAIPTQTDAARIASVLYLRANILPMAKYYGLKALALDNKNANFRLTLAEIYYKLNKKEQAIDELNKLLEMEPNNQRALSIKAQISQ